MTDTPAIYLEEAAVVIGETLSLRIPPRLSYKELEALLAHQVEQLINKDIQQFIYLLYRIDVSERQVQQALADDPAGYRQIAALIIHRQVQKITSRRAYQAPPPDDGEEKW
ncbi:hypothetical protein KTO58_25355 [Chitinophaga pendula]|uniref:hypothetical protein n=1 Tax=Chitinophaga TaxID=79328 RepID=UPI000BAF93C2|nr:MULTISPECIES: hypothetical protein [Chitinophaga]ASZ10093.1 hypothetical protein CK934_03415 [Chitinophaga sp. MD30]UCJ06954.1 hypothetical protein KTO58_25355 [Chitinophaga pendula]